MWIWIFLGTANIDSCVACVGKFGVDWICSFQRSMLPVKYVEFWHGISQHNGTVRIRYGVSVNRHVKNTAVFCWNFMLRHFSIPTLDASTFEWNYIFFGKIVVASDSEIFNGFLNNEPIVLPSNFHIHHELNGSKLTSCIWAAVIGVSTTFCISLLFY